MSHCFRRRPARSAPSRRSAQRGSPCAHARASALSRHAGGARVRLRCCPTAASGISVRPPSVVVNAYAVDDDGNALTADDVDPDADVDDKLAMRRVLNRPELRPRPRRSSTPSSTRCSGADDAKRRRLKSAERAASRSVGKSREWAAKSRERLQRSFHDLAERLAAGGKPSAELEQGDCQRAARRAARAVRGVRAAAAHGERRGAAAARVPHRRRRGVRAGGARGAERAAAVPAVRRRAAADRVSEGGGGGQVVLGAGCPTHVDEAVAARVDAMRRRAERQVRGAGRPAAAARADDGRERLARGVCQRRRRGRRRPLEHAPVDEITEEHRVAWIHQLKWAFDWNV
jgi:hypothetical protein